MTELQPTGFFREMPHGEPTDPSLADARNAAASPHEDRIAAYLDAGHICIAAPGPHARRPRHRQADRPAASPHRRTVT